MDWFRGEAVNELIDVGMSKRLAFVALVSGILAYAASAVVCLPPAYRMTEDPLLTLKLLPATVLWFVGLAAACLALLAVSEERGPAGSHRVMSKAWMAIGIGMLHPISLLFALAVKNGDAAPDLTCLRLLFAVAVTEVIGVSLLLAARFLLALKRAPAASNTVAEDRTSAGERDLASALAAPSVRSSAVRGALIAAGLATILNPLTLAVGALLLFGFDAFRPASTPRLYGVPDGAALVIVGTLVLFIPEAVWGLVFGAVFAALAMPRHWAGAIAGAVFWFFLPWACIALETMWANSNGSSIDWYSFVRSSAFWDWVVKEVGTGLMIGYVLGRLGTRRSQSNEPALSIRRPAPGGQMRKVREHLRTSSC
jgi:hypothetical protein